jgi:hypothetical protein
MGKKGKSGRKPGKQGPLKTPRPVGSASAAAGGAGNAIRAMAEQMGGGSTNEAAAAIAHRSKSMATQAAIKAKMLEMDLKERQGTLRRVDYMNECLGRLMAYMRRTLRNAPARADALGLSPELTEIVRAQIKIMCEQITIEIAKDLQHVKEYAEETEHLHSN